MPDQVHSTLSRMLGFPHHSPLPDGVLRKHHSFLQILEMQPLLAEQSYLALVQTQTMASFPPRFLIWGGSGWLAGLLEDLLKKQGKEVFTTTVRMEDPIETGKELQRVRPTHVLNCAGCTGRPNVDWCEDHKADTVRSNVIGVLSLADQCFRSNIHCTVFATGCIYQYDETHPIGGPGFTEDDAPNFAGSFYSMTKGHVEPVSPSLFGPQARLGC